MADEQQLIDPYRIFFDQIRETAQKGNNTFVKKFPNLIKNFCHYVGVTFACHTAKNLISFESCVQNLNPAQAQQLINDLRNQILSEYEEGKPEHNDINALILKIGEILRTKGTDPTIQTLFTQTGLDSHHGTKFRFRNNRLSELYDDVTEL